MGMDKKRIIIPLVAVAIVTYCLSNLGTPIPTSDSDSTYNTVRYQYTLDGLLSLRSYIQDNKNLNRSILKERLNNAKSYCEFLTVPPEVWETNCKIHFKKEANNTSGGFLVDLDTFSVTLNLIDYKDERNLLKNRPELVFKGDIIEGAPKDIWEQNPLDW